MRKPQCMIDGCERHTFAYEPVCLPHFRALSITLDADPEPAPQVAPLGEQPAPAPGVSPVPAAPLRQPTISSSKATWVEWAMLRHGVSRETAESATKAQLIALCREDGAES